MRTSLVDGLTGLAHGSPNFSWQHLSLPYNKHTTRTHVVLLARIFLIKYLHIAAWKIAPPPLGVAHTSPQRDPSPSPVASHHPPSELLWSYMASRLHPPILVFWFPHHAVYVACGSALLTSQANSLLPHPILHRPPVHVSHTLRCWETYNPSSMMITTYPCFWTPVHTRKTFLHYIPDYTTASMYIRTCCAACPVTMYMTWTSAINTTSWHAWTSCHRNDYMLPPPTLLITTSFLISLQLWGYAIMMVFISFLYVHAWTTSAQIEKFNNF
jgi:hypothetical protein